MQCWSRIATPKRRAIVKCVGFEQTTAHADRITDAGHRNHTINRHVNAIQLISVDTILDANASQISRRLLLRMLVVRSSVRRFEMPRSNSFSVIGANISIICVCIAIGCAAITTANRMPSSSNQLFEQITTSTRTCAVDETYWRLISWFLKVTTHVEITEIQPPPEQPAANAAHEAYFSNQLTKRLMHREYE